MDQIFFFSGPETTQHQNGLAHTGFAKLHAFACGSHAEPLGAKFFEGLGDFGAAVAVAVPFYDGEDHARGLALLRSGVHVVANGVEVAAKRSERALGPDRTADKMDSVFGAAGHASP